MSIARKRFYKKLGHFSLSRNSNMRKSIRSFVERLETVYKTTSVYRPRLIFSGTKNPHSTNAQNFHRQSDDRFPKRKPTTLETPKTIPGIPLWKPLKRLRPVRASFPRPSKPRPAHLPGLTPPPRWGPLRRNYENRFHGCMGNSFISAGWYRQLWRRTWKMLSLINARPPPRPAALPYPTTTL